MTKKQNTFITLVYNILVGIIIFLIPTNLFLKFFETNSYVNGLRVDYLIPKLYLSNIFILILLLTWLIIQYKQLVNWLKQKHKKILANKNIKNSIVITILFIIFLTRQFLSNHPISAIFYLFRILELGFFALFLIKNKKIIHQNLVEKSVLLTLFFQSTIALYQYTYQKSLFGYLLLGEPNLNNYIGIAKSTLFGVEKILPYGTTAHPNVLGGFLVIYLLYLFTNFSPTKDNFLNNFKSLPTIINTKNTIIFLSLLALCLTQSISAIITLILGSSLILYQHYFSKKRQQSFTQLNLKSIFLIFFSLFFISVVSIHLLDKRYPDNPSINRRNYLNTAAQVMISNNVFTGVGLNNFTSEVENFSTNREVVRFVQPVHNIFLLFFAETGLLGIVIIGLLIYHHQFKNTNFSWIIILLPIALLDHYLLTLNTGLLLIIFSIIFL